MATLFPRGLRLFYLFTFESSLTIRLSPLLQTIALRKRMRLVTAIPTHSLAIKSGSTLLTMAIASALLKLSPNRLYFRFRMAIGLNCH